MPPDLRQPGLPLSYYMTTHPETGVRVICDGCARWRRVEMADIVARLAARGVADPGAIGVRALAAHVRAPCDQCGGASFSTLPDFVIPRLPDLPA